MAEISLRAYVKDLDDLIERDQLDEVIAHCRHILQTYPKHLDVYRLLGKAYLEAKRFGDAADLFQRVLSAVPDDFVAHVGMSIVREDEGNLDAAIWHMERAFETNPSNAAIQQELRRLIGRRDGLEPHKVRLTRGALARMYAHGELFPQAIAELRSALQEDPDRPDLQVLLAEMYWRTGQRTEAADVCQPILETLPFCREANRIMAAALQAGGRAEDAVTYHRRLASLEPYAALVETAMDDPSRVEANAVRIERLAWVAGQPVPGGDGGQPEWATSLGIDARPQAAKPSAAKRPSWLESLESETAAANAAASAPPPAPRVEPPPPPGPVSTSAAPAEPSPIPDWMRGAGWTEGSGQAVEEPVSFSEAEIAALDAGTAPPPEGELARADIPDWLKDIAPPDSGEAAPPEPAEAAPAADAAEADWLGTGAKVSPEEGPPRLPPGWGGAQAEPQVPGPETPGSSPAVPTWMEEAAPGATETIVTWLGDRSKEALGRTPSAEPSPAAEQEPEISFDRASLPEGVPDWLAEEVSWGTADQAAPPAPEEGPDESAGPAWLSGVAAAAAEGESLRAEELPWLKPEGEEPSQSGMYPEEAEEEAPAQPAAEIPSWIKALAGGEQVPASEAHSPPAEQPDWLRSPQDEEPEPAGRERLDWLRNLADAEGEAAAEAPAEPPTPPEQAQAPAESLAWLRDLAVSEPPSPPADAEEPKESEAPGWLRGIGEDRAARSALGRSSAPEWLRGIAEPEPEPSEEISEEATLDWMRGIAEEEPPPAAAEIPAAASIPEEEAHIPEPAETPEWLNLAAPAGSSDAGSTGEWLRELAAEGPPAEPEPQPAVENIPGMSAASDDALDDEQVFQWLEGLAARQESQSEAAVPNAPQPIPSQAPSPEPAATMVPTTPAFAAPQAEGSLDWLEKLAEERGIEPAEAPVQPSPPSPSPEVPDWLKELVSESTPAAPQPAPPEPPRAAELPAAPETLPSLPDWMVPSASEETEPAIPLPPIPQPEPEIPEPAAEATPAEQPAMEELSDSWVPPWESLELEAPPEEAKTPQPPAPVWTPVRPSDETVYAPRRRPAEDETIFRRPLPAEPEPEEEQPAIVEPAPPTRMARPPEPVEEEVEADIPDWLRAAEEPPPATPEPEAVEDEIPDWLLTPVPYVPPRTQPVPVSEVATPVPPVSAVEPLAPEPEEEPEPEREPIRAEAPAPAVLPEKMAEPAPIPPTYEMPTPRPPEPTPAPEPVLVVPVRERAEPVAEAVPEEEPKRVEAVPPAIPAAAALERPSVRAPAGRGRYDPSQQLDAARKALAMGDYSKAASSYGSLIKRNVDIRAITDELRLALDRNPQAAVLWQTLGDAYMKGDRLQDAIEAYRRGMEAA